VHVVVVTVAHRGDDARIVHREARSLLEAGHRVTLVAPLPPSFDADPPHLVRVEVPRAVGRRRSHAWREARRAVRALCRVGDVDLLLLHDPELVPLFLRRRTPVPVVWDVHEDYVASVPDRRYIPGPLRPAVRRTVAWLEARAIARCHLILAETSYAERLGDHPVVLNATWVPEEPAAFHVSDDPPRVVYVGRIARARGALELLEVGRRLRGRVLLQLVGDPDADVRAEVQAAHDRGDVQWLGYLPNPEAVEVIRGALAGLSLLHDLPNYRGSRPTKVIEYLAHAVPVITTPLPLAAELVDASSGGTVIATDVVSDTLQVGAHQVVHSPTDRTVDGTVAAIERLLADPELRSRQGVAGHRYVREHHSWQAEGERFVRLLESWARPNGT
jgi:glycosyltransferase involved in cell wall biosynthesis